ncbi:hypothetical protein VTO42DRAFT_5145 [Malbranchea cinnamomea]
METYHGSRYTAFPDLNYGDELVPECTTVPWTCGDSRPAISTLVLSWAAVLGSLAGEENPIFSLDNEPIRVDLDTGTYRKVQVDESQNTSLGFTGIYTSESIVSKDGCVLAVRYCFQRRTGTVVSAGCTTASYLAQVARQLEYEVSLRVQDSRRLGSSRIEAGISLSVINHQPIFLAGPKLLHELVSKGGNPEKLAIEFLEPDGKTSTLSYEVLDGRSRELSYRIKAALKLRPASSFRNPVIPVLLPQSVDFYVTWLAILRAGAAVCPLNLDAPFDRINFIVNDVAAELVITKRDLRGRLAGLDRAPCVLTVEEKDEIPDSVSEFLEVSPDDFAYVMYTSGSTGLPKGVAIPHLAVTQALLAHDKHIPHFQRFLQFAAPTFDVSVFEIFFPLFRGATLVGCERSVMLNNLVKVINELNVDAAELTPTVAGELLRTRNATPCLKVLLTIGEMLTRHVVDEFGFSSPDEGILYGMYGPTEATIHCSVAAKLPTASRVGNIGVPLDSVSAFIIALDDPKDGHDPKILPYGHVGELAVGGSQLASCYLNRPDENKRAFIKTKSFGRLYRTGDKARLHPNGELECLGRISAGQIKLRGQRLELGEIEGVLARVDGVRNVAVCVIESVLVAYVSTGEASVSPEHLFAEARKWLPRYMVPNDIICTKELPRLPSGKVDRKGLEQSYVLSREGPENDSFKTDLERSIAYCASRILGFQVQRPTNLAAAGLDSLKAIKLVSSLRANGIISDIMQILEAETVSQIALSARRAAVVQELPSSAASKLLEDAALKSLKLIGCAATPQSIISCSPVQDAMVAESMKNGRLYSNWIELEFGHGIEIANVKTAFCAVAQRNEILRSGFVQVDVQGHSHAQVVWDKLEDDCFSEEAGFNYETAFGDPKAMLRPFKVELSYSDGRTRALVHIHHGLYDGWSWELIMNDLGNALSDTRLATRPQYRLVTEYYSTQITQKERQDAAQYWREHLEDAVPNTWPNFQEKSDVPRRLNTTQRMLNISVRDLDAAVQGLSISRQTVFQAAFAYMLSTYMGSSDIIFGSVSSGRETPIAGIEDIIGPCLRTLPLRLNFANFRSVRDLLFVIHNLNRKSLKHGFLPLRDIKRLSGVEPSVPLFDSLFVWQDTINDSIVPSAIVKEVASSDFLEFTMTLEFEIRQTKLNVKANYQESIVPIGQTNIFLHQIEELVSLFLKDPDMSLQDVDARLPRSVLSIENPHYVKHERLPSLAHGVETMAKSDPDRIALEFLTSFDPETGARNLESLTYAELDARSNRLANYLTSYGLAAGDSVAILLEKSLDLYVSILSVIKIGAGYVPITLQTPEKRVNFIISATNCRICITNSDVSNMVERSEGMHIVELDRLSLDGLPHDRLPSRDADSCLAYTVFTSGSTGAPKGVLITHHNLQSNLVVLSEIYPHMDGSKLLQACSHAFDVSVFEIFYSWHRGMTLCATTNDILFRDIEKVICALNVTHLSLTPTVAALVNPPNVPNVRFLVTAGEAMTPKVLGEWADKGLYQGYGPSETTNICTVKPNLSANHFTDNLGKPFKNTSAFVISEKDDFTLVPRGGLGEFCFGGTQVGMGYLNMPELTQQKFIEHPEYGRLYRSGDFGRMLPDGSLSFSGRRDELIKLRGQRIELGEINSVLLGSAAVKDCATMVHEDKGNGMKQLVSFWIPSNYTTYNPLSNIKQFSCVIEALFERIRGALPTYMVPAFLVPIPQIPMTSTGKIDKRALLEQFLQLDNDSLTLCSQPTTTVEDESPLSETESRIAEIVAEITHSKAAGIGRHTSFYRLGLDSISAIALSRHLKGSGFGQVDISVIMKNDSVAQLARILEQKNTAGLSTHTMPLAKLDAIFSEDFQEQTKREVEASGRKVLKILPCTPLQEAMLSRYAASSSGAYLNHLTFEVRVDAWRLKAAWNVMITRHDILRTKFKATDDSRFSFAQVVLQQIDLPWEEIETSGVYLNDVIDQQKSKFTMATDAIPFGLVLITEVDTNKRHLHLFIHHALYDGEAMSQLLHEVEETVLGYQLPLTVPYDLYLEQMVSANVELSDQFWATGLAQMSLDHFIVPFSRSEENKLKQFGRVSSHLDIPLSDIENYCRKSSVTLLNVLEAAWAKLLVHYSGSSDVCFGEVLSCRDIPVDGADRIVGPCFNTLPIRVKVDQSAMNSDLMKRLQKIKADILPHRLTSLRRLQSRLSPDGKRLFDTLLLLQSSPRPSREDIWKLVDETGDMDFPLIVEIIPNQQNGRLETYFHFDPSKIPVEDANTMLEDFLQFVHQTLKYPFARATDFVGIQETVPSFVALSKAERETTAKQIQENLQDDDGEKWSKEALEVREILLSFAQVNENNVTLRTTIFQLGLDSINAIQVAHRLKAIGYDIGAADIMETPSIGQIADRLKPSILNEKEGYINESFVFEAFQTRHKFEICHQKGLSQGNIETIRPCTPAQAGMLALFVTSDGDLYFNAVSLRSAAPLDPLRLRKAWTTVVDRNEILRTGFCHVDDDQSPFAMITYRRGVFDVPWCEGSLFKEDNWSLAKAGVLSCLHEPPWRVSIECLEAHTIIHFAGVHALYDAHSLDLIFSEVALEYEGNRLPEVISIEPVLGPILAKSLQDDPDGDAFWKEMGRSFQVTKFPDLNPVHGAEQEISVLSRTCSKPLDELQNECRNAGITLQAAGQAAWARLLSSYTGESNVTFGLVLSGRTMSPEAQNVVFPCLTTLPFTSYVEGSNRELLQRVMTQNAGLMKHQFTPLSKIQRLAGLDSALFDTLFVFQKHSSAPRRQEFWKTEVENTRTGYSVSLELIPVHDRLEFCLTFRRDILPEKQAEFLLSQFDHLLTDTIYSSESECASPPDADSSIISALPRKEERIPSPVDLLHQFVEVHARKCPSKTALEFASRPSGDKLVISKWTYKELDDTANKYARVLQLRGAVPGNLIGICFDKCPEAYFAILAILKIGCAYVALDPGAPIARKQFILEDSGASLLLCTLDHQPELTKLSGVAIMTLDEQGILDGVSSELPVLESPISSDATCYCLYTSGSTGTPKGCEITHDNAIQAMLSFQRLFSGHWDENSRWLQFASFHFDVSVLEQYWSWSVGICVTSCPRDILFEDLPGTIRELEITHIDLTPSLARLVHPEEVPSLCRGVFITGGEALKQEILDDWGKHRVIYNGYGPTEVTIGCTMLPRVSQNDKPSNIGPQFDNVSSFVLKPGTNIPVLRGGVGELCVSGPLVGRGYLNRPKLTEERFQFLESIGERIYRTGDLVRLLHDESFCFLGRTDDQVKLRGQRLEVEEINHVIKAATQSVQEVVTKVLRHPTLVKEQLISFINVKKTNNDRRDFDIDYSPENYAIISKIKKACHSSLPGYMIPTHIIPLTAFPLSPNNKVDNRQLKEKYYSITLDQLQSLSAPREEMSGELTEDVRKIIQALAVTTGSDAQAISPWSNIFELGLDSISVISFTRVLKDAGFCGVQPSLVMRNPVVSNLADALSCSNSSEEEHKHLVQNAKQRISAFAHKHLTQLAARLNVPIECIETVAPCTPLQEGIIYRKLQTQHPVYLSNFNFELEPAMDIQRLKCAWKQAQAHVQLLRTKFVVTDDGYAQVVLRDDTFPWFELSAAADDDVDVVAAKEHHGWCDTVSEFHDRIWEVGVVIGSTRRWMCLNIFHALYDGNSLPLLLDQVARAYKGMEFAQTTPYTDILPQGPLCRVQNAESFWTKHLKPAQGTRFPRLKDGRDQPVISVLEIDSSLSFEATRRKLNVTEQAVIHACWLDTFISYFNFLPTLGIVVSGRALGAPDAQNVIGPMFNTIPCYIPLTNVSSLSDLAVACHEYHISAIPYQHTPLRDIMKWTKKSTHGPLFESLFVFQIEDETISSLTESLWKLIGSNAEADYPLAFEAQRGRNGFLRISIVAQGNVLTANMAKELILRFRETLLAFVSDPIKKLNRPPELSSNHVNNATMGQTNGVLTTSRPAALNDSHTFEWSQIASQIRQEMATLSGIDIHDIQEDTSILEVGLDSIDAIKLSSRLRKAGIKLPVSAIMNGRTIRVMVNDVVSGTSKETQVVRSLSSFENELRACLERDGYDVAQFERILPATPLQEGMLVEMVASDYRRYFNHDVLEIEEHVDIDRLINAWEVIVRANPILRTSFAPISDPKIPFTYAQLVRGERDKVLWSVESTHGKSMEMILEDEKEQVAQAGLCSPLLRLKLLYCLGKRFLVVSVAHALYDGWSLDLLHQDIQRAYAGEKCRRPSYNTLLEHILNASGEKSSQFWKATLDGVRPGAIPKQTNAGDNAHKIHRQEKPLSIKSSKVLSFCKTQGVTPQALGLTCWALVLAGYHGQLDVVFGTILLGRDVEQGDQIMFPAMNSVAIRAILHGTRSEMLKYMQDTLTNIFEHQHFPLRKAKTLAGIDGRDLFDTLFIYQKRPSRGSGSSGSIYSSVYGWSDVEFPVCAEMEILEETVVWRVACSDTAFGERDTLSLLGRVERVFNDIVERSQEPTIGYADGAISVSQVTVLTDSSRESRKITKAAAIQIDNNWSPLEEKIRSVVALVANVPVSEISKQMSLFHLGLDSISAIKVSSLLKKESITLTVSDLLRAGTVPNMARVAQLSLQSPALNGKISQKVNLLEDAQIRKLLLNHNIDTQNVEAILPASAGQIYMWETWHSSGGKLFYPDFFYRVIGNITPEKLGQGWKKLVEQLPVLRTVILRNPQIEITHVQVVLKEVNNSIVWRNNLQNPVDRQHIQHQDITAPATLYASHTPAETMVMLHIHHALYDAVSLSGLIELLSDLCSGNQIQETDRISMADFIAFNAAKSLRERRREFWQSYLAGLKTDGKSMRNIVDDDLYPVSHFRRSLIEDITGLEVVARTHGVTIQAIFIAIYAKIHMAAELEVENRERISTGDLVFGVYLANRSHYPTLLAPTLNIVPLRVHDPVHQSVLNLARQIQRDIQDISHEENSCVSLIEIAEWTGVRLDTFVNFLRYPEADESFATLDKEVEFIPVDEEDINGDTENGYTNPATAGGMFLSFDNADKTYKDIFKPGLDIEAAIRNNGLDVGIFGSGDRLDGVLAERIAEDIKWEIANLVAEPGYDGKQVGRRDEHM